MSSSDKMTTPQMFGKSIQIFTGKYFAHWKLKAEWHLDSIHTEMMRVVNKGPIIPTSKVGATSTSDKDKGGEQEVPKPRHAWSDNDKPLILWILKQRI